MKRSRAKFWIIGRKDRDETFPAFGLSDTKRECNENIRLRFGALGSSLEPRRVTLTVEPRRES